MICQSKVRNIVNVFICKEYVNYKYVYKSSFQLIKFWHDICSVVGDTIDLSISTKI